MKKIMELKQWDFCIESLGFKKAVTLPHTWNVDDNTDVQNYRGTAKYETTAYLERVENKRAVLYFGCAYHTANVYVNGMLAGYHTGCGNTPFEFEITDFIKAGENSIVVTVDNYKKEEMLPHLLDYDWADDGGLTRNVTVTLYDPNDLFNMHVTYEIKSINGSRCSGIMNLDVDCKAQNADVLITDYKTKKTVLNKSVFIDGTVRLPFEDLKLWDTQNPNLYIIKVKTENDEIIRRTGFRTIEVKGAKVLLNGKQIYMKGCEWMPGSHPDYGMAEPLEHSIQCLSQLKNAGCVFTRFHWQQDTTLFDWCDENGLLVQEEIPYWGSPKKATPMQLEIAKRHADAMVHYHSHHPSIICWGVGNELGGEFAETINYVQQIYAYFKSIDSSRLVNYVSNSVSRDTNVDLDDATLYGDIAMWNEYLGLWQPCDDVKDVIKRTYNKFGDMPSMVTEFGLCEPAFDGGDERRAEILLERIPIYKTLDNMAGYVWFSLNDYRTHCGEAGAGKLRQRIHGSTDLYGNEKPSYEIFKKV